MAVGCGTSVIIKKGATAIAAGRAKSITINNADVEIGSGQWREFLQGCGEKSIDMSLDFVGDDGADAKALVQDMVDGAIDTYTLDFPLYGDFTGPFKVGGSLSAPRNDAITGTADFKSSGAIVYTPVI